jgi:hypothetical protein
MVFFILTLAFSLTSAGILNANTTIGMAAYAKKSWIINANMSRLHNFSWLYY